MNGVLLRDTRVRLGVSARALADIVGVTPRILGEVERGKRPVPSDWEQKLTAAFSDWTNAVRSCIATKHPEFAALVNHNSAQIVSAPVKCQMCEAHEASYHRNGEARMLLLRLVKYASEDKAVTPGSTRLWRLVDQVDDYLKRTNNPFDILRDEARLGIGGGK